MAQLMNVLLTYWKLPVNQNLKDAYGTSDLTKISQLETERQNKAAFKLPGIQTHCACLPVDEDDSVEAERVFLEYLVKELNPLLEGYALDIVRVPAQPAQKETADDQPTATP